VKKVYKLVVPLYEVVINISFSPGAIENKFKIKDVCNSRCAETAVIVNDDGYRQIYLVFTDDYFAQNTLTHECVHAAWRVLEMVGIEVDVDNQEPLAYVAGWIAEKVNDIYHKQANKG
jgi:hypothetical protein